MILLMPVVKHGIVSAIKKEISKNSAQETGLRLGNYFLELVLYRHTCRFDHVRRFSYRTHCACTAA
jgi:hypothetical protein